MTLCEYIDSVIKEKGYSRRYVAVQSGVSPSSFQSAVERNKLLSLDMLLPILRTLKLYSFNPLKYGYDESTSEIIKKSMYDTENEDTQETFKTVTELLPNINFGTAADFKRINRQDTLISYFDKLNDNGQHIAIERVEELTEIKKYRKSEKETSGKE